MAPAQHSPDDRATAAGADQHPEPGAGLVQQPGIECRRVLNANGSACKSHGWRKAAQVMGLTMKMTRPCAPRTNGKAERFI
jgi:hypothetical protein